MDVIITPTAEEASLVAARHFEVEIRQNPAAVLGLATGSTPLRLYRALIEARLDWSRIRTFNLDEYLGLGPEHPQSYHRFMWENLFDHVNIRRESVGIPDGMAQNVSAMCSAYEGAIRAAGGIDVQLLGIGTDGHIGFNEPSSSLASRTRIKTLTEKTRSDNARFFGSVEEVPMHVVTMGIGTILDARKVVLLATGVGKAEAVAGAIEGPLMAMNPASALQMHRRAVFVLDEAAAGRLRHAEYYRWVDSHRPDWQRI